MKRKKVNFEQIYTCWLNKKIEFSFCAYLDILFSEKDRKIQRNKCRETTHQKVHLIETILCIKNYPKDDDEEKKK